MASAALGQSRRLALRASALIEWRWATPALVGVLTALSIFLRTRELHAAFWIDEGLSVGIAHHHWTLDPASAAPGRVAACVLHAARPLDPRLRQTAESTHILSVIFAIGCIPFAYWVGKAAFDRVTGWYCAALAAFDPVPHVLRAGDADVRHGGAFSG